MKTSGASMFRSHLEEHFPRASICPHKEDYCDKCKALGTDMSRCRFIIKINESGNATAKKLLPPGPHLTAKIGPTSYIGQMVTYNNTEHMKSNRLNAKPVAYICFPN